MLDRAVERTEDRERATGVPDADQRHADALPRWAVWKHEAYGTTFEPRSDTVRGIHVSELDGTWRLADALDPDDALQTGPAVGLLQPANVVGGGDAAGLDAAVALRHRLVVGDAEIGEVPCRLLGEEHPDTLTSRSNLAGTLYAQGDLAGARGHLEDLAQIGLQRAAEAIAREVGIDRVFAEVLPGDKASYVAKLQEEGYRVVCAANGLDADRLLSEQRLDAALIDIRMPGMTGFELYEAIHERDKRVRVIFI